MDTEETYQNELSNAKQIERKVKVHSLEKVGRFKQEQLP
jgi:hypothetical protein